MSYTCPQCGSTSQGAMDEAEKYCGSCHTFDGAPAYIDPDLVGYWEGERYVLHKPITIGGHEFKGLDCSHINAQPGVTKEDAVHAVLNAIFVAALGEDGRMEGLGPAQ
jgi:hypothetical protein